MSKLVNAFLKEAGNDAYVKVIALKYMMLPEVLRDRGEAGQAVAKRLETVLAPLETLAAEDLVLQSTPFFRLNVHRCYLLESGAPEELAALGRHLAMTAFDSFFHLLPDGIRFTLDPVPESDLLLPRLGVRLRAPRSESVLTRRGASELEIEADGKSYRVDLRDVPPPLTLPRLPIKGYPDTYLLQVCDPAIFKTSTFDKLAPDTPAAPGLARMIGDSLDVIGAVDPELALRMTSLIHWYVPLSTPDLRTHNSFTTPHLVGVIFLSEAYNDIRLAEAMVHEFHHAELHALMEANEVVEYREDELFYSPWRPDPRPLYGLFHALHVFTGVIDFYRKAETTEELGAQVDEIRRLRQEICFKIRLGLAQVPREVPAEMGRKILESIEQELAGQEAELDIAHRPIPDKLLTHLNTWKGRNADLVSRVRMP